MLDLSEGRSDIHNWLQDNWDEWDEWWEWWEWWKWWTERDNIQLKIKLKLGLIRTRTMRWVLKEVPSYIKIILEWDNGEIYNRPEKQSAIDDIFSEVEKISAIADGRNLPDIFF